jgi:FkbM family methyltransferase
MSGEVVEVRQAFGRNWVWPKNDVWGWRGVMGQWTELASVITEVFPSGGAVALQAGGCCGMYPLRLLDHFQRVLTFEPEPLNFHCLAANCGTPRITMFQAALGSSAGAARLKPCWENNCGNWHVDWTNSGTNGALVPTPQHHLAGSDICVLTVDNLHLPALDAIFLDAEGSEDKIIAGALQTLNRCHPRLIVVETITEEMISMLSRLNYAHLQPDDGADHVFRLVA